MLKPLVIVTMLAKFILPVLKCSHDGGVDTDYGAGFMLVAMILMADMLLG